MATSVNLTLLSKSQLDQFRSDIADRKEAAFLAPQLLEQVAILSRHLKVALGKLEATRGVLAEFESASPALAKATVGCPSCQDAELRALVKRLRLVLGQE